jgi:DinB superfamily
MEGFMRSSHWLLAFSILLLSCGAACAQDNKVTPISTVSQALDFWITNTENRVVPAADAMPGEKYSFAPTAGEFTGVRTFAQQIKHLAANNYRMAAYILNQTPPPEQESEAGPDAVQSKAQILSYLKGSFAALHKAMAAINEENMLKPVAASHSSQQKTRLQFAIDAVAHSSNHYGQMVEYLRMNGIIPPASR